MTSLLCACLVAGVAAPALGAAVGVSAAGPDPAAIGAVVKQYRTVLGQHNANVPGSMGTGRREINWDGVAAAFAAPANLPANFFNSNSPRGVVLATPGAGFQISMDNNVPPDSDPDRIEFDNLNAGYSGIFQPFSAQRLFTALGSNVTEVTFFVPGTNVAATSSGFGAVFTDVDGPSTQLELFDSGGARLGTLRVPAANNGLSFAGSTFDSGERLAKVRITSGNAALGPGEAGATDVVAMDDFIFGEPSATARDTTRPKVAVRSVRKRLSVKRFRRRGVRATVTPNEPCRLQVALLGSTRRAGARRFDLILASKDLRRAGGRRSVRLKPRRRLLPGEGRYDVQVRVTAIDAGGNTITVKRTLRVRR